jgi:hypothetical protein
MNEHHMDMQNNWSTRYPYVIDEVPLRDANVDV